MAPLPPIAVGLTRFVPDLTAPSGAVFHLRRVDEVLAGGRAVRIGGIVVPLSGRPSPVIRAGSELEVAYVGDMPVLAKWHGRAEGQPIVPPRRVGGVLEEVAILADRTVQYRNDQQVTNLGGAELWPASTESSLSVGFGSRDGTFVVQSAVVHPSPVTGSPSIGLRFRAFQLSRSRETPAGDEPVSLRLLSTRDFPSFGTGISNGVREQVFPDDCETLAAFPLNDALDVVLAGTVLHAVGPLLERVLIVASVLHGFIANLGAVQDLGPLGLLGFSDWQEGIPARQQLVIGGIIEGVGTSLNAFTGGTAVIRVTNGPTIASFTAAVAGYHFSPPDVSGVPSGAAGFLEDPPRTSVFYVGGKFVVWVAFFRTTYLRINPGGEGGSDTYDFTAAYWFRGLSRMYLTDISTNQTVLVAEGESADTTPAGEAPAPIEGAGLTPQHLYRQSGRFVPDIVLYPGWLLSERVVTFGFSPLAPGLPVPVSGEATSRPTRLRPVKVRDAEGRLTAPTAVDIPGTPPTVAFDPDPRISDTNVFALAPTSDVFTISKAYHVIPDQTVLDILSQ